MADFELKKYLDAGVSVARTAGKEIKDAFFKQKTPQIKSSAGDPVTETDKLVEKMIVSTLQEVYPEHSFIGEESTEVGGQNELTDNPTWIIDPVDGTTNFVHCVPHVCVSIGLAIRKQVVVGVVYNPMLDEMYTATKGGGAYCNGNRIHVSGQEDIGRSLVYATVTKKHADTKFANMKACRMEGAGLRNFGCASESLCFIANGSLDIMYDYGLHVWDVAAGVLLVEEAGGVVLDPNESQFDLMSRRILAASSRKLASTISSVLTHIDYPRD